MSEEADQKQLEETLQVRDEDMEDRSFHVRIGRDEMNLAEFPFAMLTHRVPEGRDTITFTDMITGKDGGSVSREWTITGSEAYGLPVAGDEEVYVALMEVTEEYNFESPEVPITRYDLLRRMDWPRDGHSYQRLQESLNRLMGVSIVASNSFWDNDAKRYVDEAFHILEGYRLYDEKPGRDDSVPQSYIVWNPTLFSSFKAGNIKQLDTQIYFSLNTPLARRLFRYLDKKRYDGKATYRIKLKKLAFEKLGMSRNYYPSQIKRELKRAHDELLEKDFLRKFEYYQPRRRGSEELVVYRFAPRNRGNAAYERQLKAAENNSLFGELVSLGVTASVARELLANYSDDHINQWVSYCQYKLEQGWLPHESPAAWVVAAVRSDDWVIPDWFETEEEEAREAAQLVEEKSAELEAQRESELQQCRRIRSMIETELGIGEGTREIWEQTKERLQEQGEMSPALHSAYLLPIRGKTATIVTPVPLFCEYIQKITSDICEIITEISGKSDLEVEVACQESLCPPHDAEEEMEE